MKKLRCCLVLLLLLGGPVLKAGTLVHFDVFLGANPSPYYVDVELYDQDKPVTVNNFIRLIQSGAYNQGFFHRCVPGFVIQGGGFSLFNEFSTNVIAPPYSNVGVTPNFGMITNEFRVANKLAQLKLNPILGKLAQGHADNMAKQDRYGDDGKNGHIMDGAGTKERFLAADYKFKAAGENVGSHSATASQAKLMIDIWLQSPGHRQNMANTPYIRRTSCSPSVTAW